VAFIIAGIFIVVMVMFEMRGHSAHIEQRWHQHMPCSHQPPEHGEMCERTFRDA
jgi:cell division protein FtsW (lipid II flippase)